MKTEKLAEKVTDKTEPERPTSNVQHPTSNGDPGELKRVAYGSVRPDANQPRKTFTAAAMSELTESIRESGITQPLLVRFVPGLKVVEPDLVSKQWQALDENKRVVSSGSEEAVREFVNGKEEGYYQIVDGERRWRAAGVLKLPELPVIVRKLDTRQIFTIQFVANQQRENLSALEEARAFQEQIAVRRKTEPGYNADALAKEVGMSRSHVFGRLALTRLQPAVEQAVLQGKISVSVAGLVAMVPEPKQQEKLLKALTDEEAYGYPYSFRDVQEMLEKEYVQQLDKAPFDVKDEKLAGGACASCPKRSGNMAELFPELAKRPNVCTDPKCYAAKEKAGLEAKLAAAKEKGEQILTPEESKKLFSSYSPRELNYNTSYMRLNECCYDDPKQRTYEQLLKKDAPKPVVAVNGNGELTKLYSKKEVEAALKQKGFGFMEKDTRDEKEQKARKLLIERRSKVEMLLLAEMVTKLEALPTDTKTEAEFWRFVIGWMEEDRWHEVAGRRQVKGTADHVTKKLGLKEVRALAVEMLLVDPYNGLGLVDYQGKWHERFEAAAEFAGLDLKAREKALMEPELPKQEATAKNAKSTKKG